ncbi:hypothetical protein HKD37_20G055839 [Glycine soja]
MSCSRLGIRRIMYSITSQVDVPSTCTTKDVPSNVLRQRILRRKGKNQKNSQAVSPLNLLSRGGRENQKNSQEISLVKVVWGRASSKDATWELEGQMRDAYPTLFDTVNK